MLGVFIAAGLLMAGPAFTPNTHAEPNIQPPVELQYDTGARVAFVDVDLPNYLCGEPDKGYVILACTEGTGGLMILPNPCQVVQADPTDRYAQLVCHEMGHHNGWPGDHKGGTVLEPKKK